MRVVWCSEATAERLACGSTVTIKGIAGNRAIPARKIVQLMKSGVRAYLREAKLMAVVTIASHSQGAVPTDIGNAEWFRMSMSPS